MSLRTATQRIALEKAAKTLPPVLGKHRLVSKNLRVDVLGHLMLEAGYTLQELRDIDEQNTLFDELETPRSRAAKAYGYARPGVTVVEAFLTPSDTLSPGQLRDELVRIAGLPGDKNVKVKVTP